MTDGKRDIKKGDLVLVQPMRYCISFTEGGIESLNAPNPQMKITHHWTEDGFKARVLEVVEIDRNFEGQSDTEEYLKIKLFGRGRKHFVKRNEEKTKIAWVQSRLASKCEEEGKKKKKP